MNRFRADPRLLAPLLAGLGMLGPFSIDAFFPAFRIMGAEFDVAAETMQQTLTAYLLSFSLMSLIHGPLADAYGRRGVILWSVVGFVAATFGCALATSFSTLLAFRVLQGVCAGAGMIVGRAVIRDLYDGAAAQRLMAQVSFIFGFAPAIAPIIGGAVLATSGWRAIFWWLAGFGALLVLATLVALPETHPRAQRRPLRWRAMAKTYATMAADSRFLLLGVAVSFNFGALFLYIASAPVVVMTHLGLGEQSFAWLFGPVIGGMMLGSAVSARLAGRLPARRQLRLAYGLMATGSALNLLQCLMLSPQVPWFVLPVALIGVGVTLAFPMVTLLMLDRFPAARGSAASVQATLNLGFSSGVAGLVSPLVSSSPIALALTSAAMTFAGFLCWRVYCRRTPDCAPQSVSEVVEPAGAAPPSSGA